MIFLLFIAPNLKQKVRVRLINAQGLEEAGVDGGGLFRYSIRTKGDSVARTAGAYRGLFADRTD